MISEKIISAAVSTGVSAKKIWLKHALERETLELMKAGHGSQGNDRELRKAYHDFALPYWKRYGRRPKFFWFKCYGSRDGIIHPGFIPADIYYTELVPYLNDMRKAPGQEDKCRFEMFLSDVRQSVTICRRISGEYYDKEMQYLRERDAISLCLERLSNGTDIIIKKAVQSDYGSGITIVRAGSFAEEGGRTGESFKDRIRELFRKSGSGFIVQEMLRQHPSLDVLCPTAVSTIRVCSLFFGGEVYMPAMSFRSAVAGREFIGGDKGTWSAEILDDGRLYPVAVYENGEIDRIDNKERFDPDFMIPGMEELREIVRNAHKQLPDFRWIGWDFAIADDGRPVMLEYNLRPSNDTQRVICKPIFGDMTETVLEDYFHGRSLEENHSQLIMLQ